MSATSTFGARGYKTQQKKLGKIQKRKKGVREAEQLVSLHFHYTVTHTHIISAHLYTLRCQSKAFNTHPRHTLENRIDLETAYHALCLSTSCPGLPTMPMSVALAKPGNRGQSYTTYLKHNVTTEWIIMIRQLTASHPPQPAHATPTGPKRTS